ncbi:cache domain-containing protein [Thiomicrorhabdus sp. zzn3]|uniref:cache domain-containing protein n=1 Tax=Thiomicrorhabdus sp. zzn3 TaxID=3039775 RepID=UPI0024366074|nr:cache domain-containing protein [Thiomicrorhabdus sp. zzn3]MDG6778996.1 cache domain-containing protein [Thiomicrorhabdus sp. zzn3]
MRRLLWYLPVVAGLFLAGLFALYLLSPETKPSWQQRLHTHFQQLVAVSDQQKHRLTDYLYRQVAVAEALVTAPQFQMDFKALRKLGGDVNTQRYLELEQRMEEHFVFLLEGIYDMLFISPQGKIFFTVKKEADFGKALDDPLLKQTGLARVIAQAPQATRMVSFEPYFASAEPAAFIIVPVGVQQGYVAFQMPINQIDAMLRLGDEMGQTGEVYLVDEQKRLLTSSRFMNAGEQMAVKVNTLAANAAINGERGSQIIEDYREVKVLSHYQPLLLEELPGIHWGLISEKDLDEVLAEYYLEEEDRLYAQLERTLIERQRSTYDGVNVLTLLPQDVKVDMSEYQRLSLLNDQGIYTLGAATCSVLTALMPNEFVYMAHVSPTDRIYRGQASSEMNLLEQMLHKIYYFELPPARRDQLRFYLTATHTESLKGVLRLLLSQGVRPKQLMIELAPQARSVNVRVDAKGRIQTQWVFESGKDDQHVTYVNFRSLLMLLLPQNLQAQN